MKCAVLNCYHNSNDGYCEIENSIDEDGYCRQRFLDENCCPLCGEEYTYIYDNQPLEHFGNPCRQQITVCACDLKRR